VEGHRRDAGSVITPRRAAVGVLSALLAALTLLACTDGSTGGRDPADVAARAMQAIASRDWSALARLADPVHGVRFSPYAYVDTTGGVVLSSPEIAALGSDSQLRRWGTYDGSGEPIQLTAQAYLERFVCDRDFASVEPGPPNERIGTGNSMNNIGDAYSGRDVVFFEYYLPGTDAYAGMDWRSLRLVVERRQGRWHLVGVVHDEWTI
jgi:hypothetical protein